MRIRTHHSSVHSQCRNLRIHTLLTNFHVTIRTEQIHSVINSPFRAAWHLHIPKLLHPFHLGPTLEQTDSFLASHGSLQMIIIRISGMMRNDNIRLTLFDSTFNKLHQSQMRHRIHLDIRESRFKYPIHSQVFGTGIRIILQLIIIGTERTSFCFCTHDSHIYNVAILGPSRDRSSRSQNLIVGMSNYN